MVKKYSRQHTGRDMHETFGQDRRNPSTTTKKHKDYLIQKYNIIPFKNEHQRFVSIHEFRTRQLFFL
jgi:hypothetical protein